jgi:cysteate synthase
LLQLDERYLLELVARSRVDNIKFSDFLPWCSNIGCNPEVGIVRNEIIESELGLSDLSIIYSGFYPQIGGTLRSATFKEYEALSVLNWANLFHANKVLCISSAGNAGRAFFQVAVQKNIPIIVIVPEFALQDFIMPESIKNHQQSHLLIAIKNGVYSDAIQLINILINKFGDELVKEGGVYNIARRCALSYPYVYDCIDNNRVPDHYFQAVGSATGAIATHEANLIINKTNAFQKRVTKIHMAQNTPFTPIVDTWNAKSDSLASYESSDLSSRLSKVKANVLSNTTPPYYPVGGIKDVLSNSSGEVYSVKNTEIQLAKELWSRTGTDVELDPASLVAISALQQAIKSKKVLPGDSVALHLTGGGLGKMQNDENGYHATPSIVIGKDDHTSIYDLVDDYLLNFRKKICQD